MRLNKKGFTLVELLAVIVVLAIIMIIAIPAVVESMNNAKKGSFKIYAEKALGNAQSTYSSEDLLETISANHQIKDSNNNVLCYCYPLADIGLKNSGSYSGYVVVKLDNKREASYYVTLTDKSYHVKNGTYANLGESIGEGTGGVSATCPTDVSTCNVTQAAQDDQGQS